MKETESEIALRLSRQKEYEMLDIIAPQDVEILIKSDSKVIWVNVDGRCAFRACRIKNLTLNDERNK